MLSSKTRLFDKAIELFSLHGYENVSINNIANAAGLRGGSAFYNHYTGKEELLTAIYDYYEAHYFANVKPLDEIRPILKTGTGEDIMGVLAWTFYGLPADMHRRMTLITKIVYARFLIDERANNIFVEKMTVETIDDVILKLRELAGYGRLNNSVDLASFAEMMTYVGLMIGLVGVSSNYQGGIVDDRRYLKKMLADYLAYNMFGAES